MGRTVGVVSSSADSQLFQHGTGKVAPQPTSPKRARLSVFGESNLQSKILRQDSVEGEAQRACDKYTQGSKLHDANGRTFSQYACKSTVGKSPFNDHKVNQDRAFVLAKLKTDGSKSMFGVFDGHGQNGHDVSHFLQFEFPKAAKKENNLWVQPKIGLENICETVTKGLNNSNIDCKFSGSTGTIVYLDGTKIWSANVGDSRAVLARKNSNGGYSPIALTEDQKPHSPAEKKRIEKYGGRVEAFKAPDGEKIGEPRVWLKKKNIPGLAMGRSFGDDIATTVGVISKPVVKSFDRTDDDDFIVVASDGVFEFLSNQEVVDLISKASDPELACAQLTREATKRWNAEEDVVDDITCVIIKLSTLAECQDTMKSKQRYALHRASIAQLQLCDNSPTILRMPANFVYSVMALLLLVLAVYLFQPQIQSLNHAVSDVYQAYQSHQSDNSAPHNSL